MDLIVLLSLIVGIVLLAYHWVHPTALPPAQHGSQNQDANILESVLGGREHSSKTHGLSAPAKSFVAKSTSKKATSSSGKGKAVGTSGSRQKTGKVAKGPQSKPTQARPKAKAPNGTVTVSGGAGAKSRRSARTGSRTS